MPRRRQEPPCRKAQARRYVAGLSKADLEHEMLLGRLRDHASKLSDRQRPRP